MCFLLGKLKRGHKTERGSGMLEKKSSLAQILLPFL